METSRRNNEENGVTGLLMYEDGNFMQALEGPPERVTATMERIHSDSRHRDVRVIVDFLHAERAFPQWDMGFELRAGPAKDRNNGSFGRDELIGRLRQPNLIHQLMRKIGAGSFFR